MEQNLMDIWTIWMIECCCRWIMTFCDCEDNRPLMHGASEAFEIEIWLFFRQKHRIVGQIYLFFSFPVALQLMRVMALVEAFLRLRWPLSVIKAKKLESHHRHSTTSGRSPLRCGQWMDNRRFQGDTSKSPPGTIHGKISNILCIFLVHGGIEIFILQFSMPGLEPGTTQAAGRR